MNAEICILIIGMAVVTYIPRALPAALIGQIRFNPKIEKFLQLIPYTAMAALVFPGIFFVDQARPEIGIIGAIVAGLLAWRRCPLMVCVLGAVGADLALYLLLP